MSNREDYIIDVKGEKYRMVRNDPHQFTLSTCIHVCQLEMYCRQQMSGRRKENNVKKQLCLEHSRSLDYHFERVS